MRPRTTPTRASAHVGSMAGTARKVGVSTLDSASDLAPPPARGYLSVHWSPWAPGPVGRRLPFQ